MDEKNQSHDEINNNATPDPYRILFPSGVFLGFFALVFWFLFNFRLLHFYPREAHSQLMFFGFLYLFVAGFLMTAVPRMTQTKSASWFEIGVPLGAGFLQLVLSLRNQISGQKIVYLLQILFLIYFVGRRFYQTRRVPFEGFIYIPFAFVAALCPFLLSGFKFFQIQQLQSLRLGGELFILNLVFGIGSRLIPVLSRLPQALKPDQRAPLSRMKEFFATAILLNMSFYLEICANPQWLWLKLAVIMYIAVFHLGLFKKPQRWSALSIGLKSALTVTVWGVLLSGLSDLFPFVASLHLIYIGGFSLITLMVASRVIVAHGGRSLDEEIKNKNFYIVACALILSAILRWIGGPEISGSWIHSSIIFFWVALVIWLYELKKSL